jgi:hypothetical protein
MMGCKQPSNLYKALEWQYIQTMKADKFSTSSSTLLSLLQMHTMGKNVCQEALPVLAIPCGNDLSFLSAF